MREDDSNDLRDSIIWSNVLGLLASWIVWNPFQDAVYTYWQIFLYALGATPAIITLIAAVSELTLSLARIPGGYLADKIGRRTLIVTMTYVIAVSYLLMFFAKSWQEILIINVVMNTALFYQPALDALIADSFPKKARGRGFALLSTIPSIVAIASPYLAYLFISKHGIVEGTRRLFLLAFISGLIAATIRVLSLKETVSSDERLSRNVFSDFVQDYRTVLRHITKKMKVVIIVCILFSLTNGLTYLIQLFALNYLGISEGYWALVQTIVFILNLLLVYPCSFIVDRIGRKLPLMIGSLTLLTSIILLVYAPVGPVANPYILASLGISSISFSFFSSALPAIQADLLPSEYRGRGYAIIMLMDSVSLATGEILSGIIYDTLGPRSPFSLAAIVCVILTIVSLKTPETIKSKE
ncbi:MAG: MFS transporter [Candidatus Njordarchaeales archaeon]